VSFRQRAAKYGKILCEDENFAAVNQTVTGNDAVAEKSLLVEAEIVRAMDNELVKLLECSVIKKEADPLASGHFAGFTLLFEALDAAAFFGKGRAFFEEFKF